MVGDGEEMEVMEEDRGVGEERVEGWGVGVGDVDGEDVEVVGVFEVDEVVGEEVVGGGGEEVEEGWVVNVGENGGVGVVEV